METTWSSPCDWKEWRRLRALELKKRGWRQRVIAEAFGVTEAAVSKWLAVARQRGVEALLAHPSPGPAAKLTADQMALVPDFLWHGAEAYGFRGDVWTCARVAKVLQREFGVSYHKHHVSRILKDLGWTPQIPIRRAIQADDVAIENWRTVIWPELKAQARRERRILVFIDESGFYLLPGLVKTYGPRGQTPFLVEWQSKDHLSVMSGVTPQGKLYTLVRQETFTAHHSLVFLEHLRRQIPTRLLVIWDRSPIHRGGLVRAYLAGQEGKRIHLEYLPPYAPELNPDEGVWQHLKHVELRNKACLDIEELHFELHLAIARLRQKAGLIRAFFNEAGLK
jgi:transposase